MSDPDLVLRMLAEFRQEMREFKEWTINRFEQIEQRFDKRFDDVDKRFDEVDKRIDNTNAYLVAQNARLSTEISAVRGTYDEIEPKQG